MISDHKYDYAELTNELFKISRRWILDNSGSLQDAEDLTQEALIVLYRKSNTQDFVLSVKPTTFLMGVVKCLWYKRLRSKSRLGFQDEGQQNIEEICLHAIETSTKDSSYFLALHKGIQMLGEGCQKIIRMFYYEQQSMEEISSSLGFSGPDVAKTSKSRCMKKLKNITNDKTL